MHFAAVRIFSCRFGFNAKAAAYLFPSFKFDKVENERNAFLLSAVMDGFADAQVLFPRIDRRGCFAYIEVLININGRMNVHIADSGCMNLSCNAKQPVQKLVLLLVLLFLKPLLSNVKS